MTRKGLFDGKGRMTHANGDIYQGEWKEGKACGAGIFIDKLGSMYEGEWYNDLYHGRGTEQWDFNKIVYTGEFVQGQKTGQGKFEFEGNTYEGYFIDGKFNGHGKYQFSEIGQVYEGNFENNNMHGRGKMTWANGTYYDGEFCEGRMEGVGKRTYENGDWYEGEWKDDMRNGQGVYYSAKDNKELRGDFKDDEFIPAVQEPMGSPWKHMRKKVIVQDYHKNGFTSSRKQKQQSKKTAETQHIEIEQAQMFQTNDKINPFHESNNIEIAAAPLDIKPVSINGEDEQSEQGPQQQVIREVNEMQESSQVA